MNARAVIVALFALVVLSSMCEARVLNPSLGRWLSRDTAGYVEPANLPTQAAQWPLSCEHPHRAVTNAVDTLMAGAYKGCTLCSTVGTDENQWGCAAENTEAGCKACCSTAALNYISDNCTPRRDEIMQDCINRGQGTAEECRKIADEDGGVKSCISYALNRMDNCKNGCTLIWHWRDLIPILVPQ